MALPWMSNEANERPHQVRMLLPADDEPEAESTGNASFVWRLLLAEEERLRSSLSFELPSGSLSVSRLPPSLASRARELRL
jgi:hypothetical protein